MANGSQGMMQSRLTVAIMAAAFSMVSISDTYSQSTGPSGGTASQGASTDSNKQSTSVTDYRTNAIVQDISSVRNECARLEPEYRIDCLRQGLKEVVRRMPQGGDYREARAAVARAVGKLSAIHGANIDGKAPRKRSRGNSRFKVVKTYAAIKRQNLNKAMEQARKVIKEAETTLLRSAENSEKRSSHYQKIAAAIGSTKVLLRSA